MSWQTSLSNWETTQNLDYVSFLGYLPLLWPIWVDKFTFLRKKFEKYNLLKAFLFFSHFHLLFPRLLLRAASSYLHLAGSHHQLRRNCVKIEIFSEPSGKYRLRFEFLHKLKRAFLVKCIHCGAVQLRLGVFRSYILSSILRRFYSCCSLNGIYSADKAD